MTIGDDVLELPIELFRGKWSIGFTLELRDKHGAVAWCASRAGAELFTSRGFAVWSPHEVHAVALALEAGRADALDVAVWSDIKRRAPPCVVDPFVAMRGAVGLVPFFEIKSEKRIDGRRRWVRTKLVARQARGVVSSTKWTLGELVRRLEHVFVAVHLHPPLRPATPATPTGDEFAKM